MHIKKYKVAAPGLLRLLFVLLAGAGGQVLADEDFPGVRKLMSEEEFRASGLSRLSQEELKALNAWLIRYTAGEATVLQDSSEAVREAKEAFAIESRISGDFTGWTGKTFFKLENGQLWQQRLNGKYQYRGPANPAVRIDRNWLGFYRLTLVETGRSVGVSLVER